ncbi:MAG: terminase small subunit [Candidatus Riflebacteria bacterium]|nr:terminase small subunit [Candidatus Riflebacteria bacterium]
MSRSRPQTRNNGGPDRFKERREFFCREYLKDLNGTQAAIRAGYSAKTATSKAAQLLARVDIRARIDELKVKRAKRCEITADRVLKELARIGFANMGDFASFNNASVSLNDSGNLSRAQLAAVSEVSRVDTEFGGTTRIKLHDKVSSLELIGRHLAMFVDRHKHEGDRLVLVVEGGPQLGSDPKVSTDG